MACNYSNKFLPLVQSIARRLEGNLPALEAELANLFTNPEVALADVKGQVTFASEQKDKPVIKEPIKINTRQATIGVQSGSSIASAYLGRSDAYSTMIKDFRRKILEMARIKINFETGIVENIQANADQNGISVLNRNIFDYKLSLLRQVLKATNNGELFDIIEQQINDALADKDFDLIDSQLNGLIDVLQMLEDIPAEVYDAYVILSNFDKLLKQECPFIEIDSRYDNSESIKKYEYIGANVSHFTGWTSSEFADSMDQASMLVKSVLDYIPEVNEAGNPIQGSSIGLSGFYSVMTAMRNTLLYHADESLLQLRKKLLKGVNVDMVELIDAYIKYLQNPTQNTGNVSSFFDSHKTYLIGKLKGIRNFIFNSNIDKELKDIFNNMFFKNVQMSYVAYTYDMLSGEFGGTDLKANAITQQAYTLSGTIASAIYNWRTNPDSFKRIIYVNDEFKGERVKYRITKYNRHTGEATILYNGKEFTFGQKSISTTFDLAEFKSIFFDLFGYMIPDDFETVGKQINGGNNKWDYRQELGKILRLGLQGGCFKWGSIEYENEYPTNLQNWYSDFANVGKIISTIYGADTVNVVKNVSKKNNLPLFGLNSLAYNFPFIMWNHMDSESNDDSVYEKSFLFDKVDSDGKVIAKSIVGEPKVRSEVMYEGKLKSASKLTVAEVAKLSILDDFYRNFINPESDHIYLQNATFADKGTHFLVNYNLNTAIYGDRTLRQLIDEQMKSSHPNRTNMFNLIYNSRSRRIKKLVKNILEDYSKVFTDGTFTKLSDIDDYIRKHKLSHTDVKNAFLATEGVNFYEEIHLSKGKVNETIALYYDTYTDKNKLAKRLDEQRAAFAKDLAANRVKMATYMDSISKQIGNSYKDWVADDGTIILSKEENGKTVLHPVLEGYFMANDLLSNEYNEVMIGGVYAHSKNTESSRLIAQIKRSVIFGATMHSFAQGLDNGVADEVHIACMPDVQAYVQNIVGTEQTNDSMDGSGLCTMLQARLESNSLLDARVGYDKKSIGHDIDSRYGRPSLLKWAVYAMTNARRRIAYGSNISQEALCRKAYSHGNINLDVNELNEILAKIGPVYFKDVENTGKYYKIVQFRVNESGQIERALQEVTANGTELNNRKIVPMNVSNTLWDIDQLFGGAWAMTLENGNLEYSESNVDALEAYVIKHQDAKTKQIGYIVNKSAMKVGVGNLNSDESWTDDSGLHTITMRTRYIGVQMDAEHHLDENEVTEMTQMISALSENGYTSSIVNSIYTDIGNVIMEALKEYDDTIATNDPEKVYKLLGELFIKSFENNDRDTLGLAQAFVLKASKALKESGSDFRLPFSAETVNGLFVSTVSSLLTKKGIRRKYEGFAGVLTPSYNMMQYYNVGGQTMMYEKFTDLVREKGITSTNNDPNMSWSRFSDNGYEVSSQGDTRFSALFATFKLGTKIDGVDVGGKTIEWVYQNVIKKSGKGKAPAPNSKLWNPSLLTKEEQEDFSYHKGYLPLWQEWAKQNPFLIDQLRIASRGKVLTDKFANTRVSQARALSDILNEERKSAISRAINDVYIDGELNPFLDGNISADQVDFEDTVVIFDTDLNGNIIMDTERIMYIQSFSQYDEFKHMDMTGKKVYNFTSRPKNLKATNTKFKVAGVQHSVYELDSVRAMFYYKQGTNSEFVSAILASRGYIAVESNKMFETLQKIVQQDLRNLEKGRDLIRVTVQADGTYVTSTFRATDVQVTPAQLITGRYHAKEFMMEQHENISDVLEKKEGFFIDKLRTKYNFTDDEPDFTEMVLFSKTGERYLVQTASESDLKEGYSEDKSIEKINGTFYLGEEKITNLEGVRFCKYRDEETGKVWNVIIVDSETTKRKLYRSSFFEFYRHNYKDQKQMDQEHIEWKKRIERRASRMYKSFMEQRKMLGTRIPTQAMQSFMPMEIVGYTDSAVNDVYVPVQQFFLQGSDLDIDKVYLLGYGVNSSGKLVVNSKLADYAEYSYDELMDLLPPNGREYELSETVDDDTHLINSARLSSESWIDIINEVITSGKSKIAFDKQNNNTKQFFKQLNIHTTTELSDQDVDAAIKNQVVHNVLKVASNAENQVIAQISVDAATVDLKAAGKKSHLAAYEKTITSDNPMTIFAMQVQNMVGREVIGVTAVALKQFFAKTAFYNDKINKFTEFCLKDPDNVNTYVRRLVQLVVKTNPLTNQRTVFANLNFLDAIDSLPNYDINIEGFTKLHDLLWWLQNEANKNDAALTISGILTLATDNAKELILSKLNATSALADIYTYLTSLGTDVKTIADIMIPGSFTYIAKLQEGDLFNSFTGKITIDNAIKFYLGEYTFGIQGRVLKGLFDVTSAKKARTATFDSNKVKLAIQKCAKALETKKQREAELRAWRQEMIDSGVDPNEFLDAMPNEPEEVEYEGGTPPIPIESLSTPEIYKIMTFLQECLERNANREIYAKDPTVDNNLRLILTKVLPGVREQSMMGKMAGINQGLKTKAFDKISFKQNIDNYINNSVNDYYSNRIAEVERELAEIVSKLKKDPTDQSLLTSQQQKLEKIEQLKLEWNSIPEFDFYEFVQNKAVQDAWIKRMEKYKHTDNILEIIVNVPHFKQMLHTWAVDETLLAKSSVRHNLEREFLKEIKPESTYSFKDLEFKQIKQYVNDTLILSWILSKGFTLKVDQDQIEKYGIKIYDATGTPINIPTNEFRMNSIIDVDSFKQLMENWIVPELKTRFPENAFLQALIKSSDNTKAGIKSYLKLPIPMMDIDKSVEIEAKYNAYLTAFDDISTQMFAGMKVADLFYLYNLIVNKDSFGQKSLTRLFENLVNSNKGSFLVNDFNQWIGELDITKDTSKLLYNLDDLKGRIGKYVPNTSIEGSLDGIMTPDSCFEVPNLAKSPIKITTRKTVDPQPQIQVPTLIILKDVLPPSVMENYSDDLSSGSEVRLLSDEDWDDAFMGWDYLDENRDFLRKQKSFIYNGKLYINVNNASFGDMVHEWAHIILAQLKWSDDPKIRDKYYEIVAKVVDHPRFNDIAQHYPWANGSDLQEEVLVNLFQMYLQNKIFTGDNILRELNMLSSKNFVDSYDGLVELVEQTFVINVDRDMSLEDATLSDIVQLFGSGFYDQYLRHDNSYILKKHQKISAMKDQMVKDETLKMVCE